MTITKATSINDHIKSKLTVYPNPATDKLYIIGIQGNEKFEIYNNAGTLVSNPIVLNNWIDISGLKTGYYFVKGKSFSAKFLKK